MGVKGEGAVGAWLNFCWVCATGLSDTLNHYHLFCDQLLTPILVTFGQICYFAIPVWSPSISMN